MSSTKFLGKKRESIYSKEIENEPKEESTQSEQNNCPFDVIYINYSIDNDSSLLKFEDLKYIFEENENPKKKIKLGDDFFKLQKSFKLESKKVQNLAPHKSKSVNFNELLKNENEYLYHFFRMKNYTINELKKINLMKNIPDKKFHMILDIDQTMVKAVARNEIPAVRNPTDFEISGLIDRNIFEFYCRYRPFLLHFIHELRDYFHFYISTLGHINYANKIIQDLIQKAEISLPQINIVSNNSISQKLVKSLQEIIPLSNKREELDDTVIIDDIINYWIKPPMIKKTEDEIKQCIKCLIPSKRYVIQTATGNDTEKYGLLIHNNIFEQEYSNDLKYSIEADYSLCIEKDSDSENGKKGQFYYLEIFLKNCIKFCMYSGKTLVESMDFFRKKVFENCKFNLRFLDNEWNYVITNLIKELGGDIVVNPEDTTHIIIRDKINRDKITWIKSNQYIVNINYIFQCYFNLCKMDEDEEQVKFMDKSKIH